MIIEVPHFASLRGKQREIIVLRSDNGETWKEHTLEANEEAIQEVLNQSFDGEGNNLFLNLKLIKLTMRLFYLYIFLYFRTKPIRGFTHKSNNTNINERLSALFCCCFSNKARGACYWTGGWYCF